MIPRPPILTDADAVAAITVLEPTAYRRPGGKSTIKFACRLRYGIVVRVCKEDLLFRTDVDHEQPDLRALGFFAEARKLLLYGDGARSGATPWKERALVEKECESRERVVEFADYRDLTQFTPLTGADVCQTFDPKSTRAPKEITYFVRWAPEQHTLQRRWSWESGETFV